MSGLLFYTVLASAVLIPWALLTISDGLDRRHTRIQAAKTRPGLYLEQTNDEDRDWRHPWPEALGYPVDEDES